MRALVLLGWSILFVAEPLSAKDGVPVKPATKEMYSAIGRATNSLEPGRGCTAVLVASDWVATAAHCAPYADNMSRFRFLPGYFDGSFLGEHTASDVYVHPRRNREAELSGEELPFDIALVRLSDPIETITPVALVDFDPERPLSIVGYQNRSGSTLMERHGCATVDWSTRLIFSDCEVVSGDSGAPAFQMTEFGLGLIGIVSAKVGGPGSARSAIVIPDAFIRGRLVEP